MKIVKVVLISVLLLLSVKYSAQDKKYIDSLTALTTSKVDSIRFNAYTFLSWNLKETDKTLALNYANKLLDEATAANNQKWIVRAFSDLCGIYLFKGEISKAQGFAEKALLTARKAGNKKDIAGALINLASIKGHNNEFANALELQLEALKLYEELKKNYYVAITCNSIATSYTGIGNYKLSNIYLKKAFAIKGSTIPYRQNQALTMAMMGDNYKNLNAVDSSIYSYKEAQKIFEEIGDQTNVATAYTNIGSAYQTKGDLKNAEINYNASIKISTKIEDLELLAFGESSLAGLYIEKGKYIEAETLLLNALEVAKKLGSGETELTACKYLTELYIQKKDPEKATLYFDKHTALKDSVFTKDVALRFSEAQTKFDVEKKDLELAKNKAEIEAQEKQNFIKNIIIISVIVLLLLSGILAVMVFRKKQIQQQAKLDAEIASQKEIRSKAIMEAEEKERRRIAQDLHDGVGQILSAAKLNLSGLESQIDLKSEKQKEAFKTALDLIDDSVKEVRIVSHNMMPNTLIKLGLASAIKEFITKIQGTPNLKVNLEIVGLTERLEQEKETVLYRVIQEVVANIIKHAKATEIGLQLIKHEKELSIIIDDNGIGFDTSKINSFEGIGLKNIISRVEFINGTVHFDSTLNKGTTVIIEIQA
ncbi:MAG: sensor histidine kinase [Bacteroidetes bacterium]|nr:sensor histidine kinase [Bacteroidota bacterium]